MVNKLVAAAASDPDKLDNGTEVTYFVGDKEFRSTIKRGGDYNKEFQTALEKAMRPYRNSGVTFEQLPLDKQRLMMRELVAEHILIGWREEDFGEAFSKDNAKAMFEQVPEYLTFLMKSSGDAELFRKKAIEDTAGN